MIGRGATQEVLDQQVTDGAYRHPVRFKRLRLDMTAFDVPPFGSGGAATAG
ncbi:hypothetical protein [Streptomyces sp. NPDC048606]|uniref:hypothetical protein n=1 Tax=Streptomyces sp. NPDC048606 TaxID=3154726 RepID=UPI00341339AA